MNDEFPATVIYAATDDPQQQPRLLEFIYVGRIAGAARHVADIEGHARCTTSQWEELADAFARVTEHADAIAALVGHPDRATDLASHALDYGRAERVMDRCFEWFPTGTGWQRHQARAIAACDAIIDLVKHD